MTRGQNLAVVVTCLVAALAFAGAVTMPGLGLFVLPGVLGAAIFGSILAARRMSGTALILGGVLVLGWSELVNVWSGIGYGTAARSSFVAAGCTLLAVVCARSEFPALFLVAIAASVCGALLLGAGGELPTVAVAAAVSAVLTQSWIERSRRVWTGSPRRGASLVLLPLFVGAIAVAVVLVQVRHDPRQPKALAAGLAYPHLKPPWHDPLAAHPRSTPLSNRGHKPPPPAKRERHPKRASGQRGTQQSRVWLYVAAGTLLLLVLALAGRLLAVRLAWRRVRRRLAGGGPAEQITGAWAWMRLRLAASRLPLAAAVSPDLVAAGNSGSSGTGLPPEVIAPLRTLATVTSTAAFAGGQSLSRADVTAAWAVAGQVDETARDLLPRHARVGMAFRGPDTRARGR